MTQTATVTQKPKWITTMSKCKNCGDQEDDHRTLTDGNDVPLTGNGSMFCVVDRCYCRLFVK